MSQEVLEGNSGLSLEEENKLLRRLLGRNPNTRYTYYKLELKNINEEWDEVICDSLDDVLMKLQYLDIHLDDDTPTESGEERQVIITGIAMTPIEYDAWYQEAYKTGDIELI